MTKVQIRNFDGVIKEFTAKEVDHIEVVKHFDVDVSVERHKNDKDFKVVKMYNYDVKSHRLLEVYHYNPNLDIKQGTMYYFDAEKVWISFE